MYEGAPVQVAGRPLSDLCVSGTVFRRPVNADAVAAERVAIEDRRRMANEDAQELFGSEYWEECTEDGAYCAPANYRHRPAWFPPPL